MDMLVTFFMEWKFTSNITKNMLSPFLHRWYHIEYNKQKLGDTCGLEVDINFILFSFCLWYQNAAY